MLDLRHHGEGTVLQCVSINMHVPLKGTIIYQVYYENSIHCVKKNTVKLTYGLNSKKQSEF